MDKINLADPNRIFGSTEEKVLYTSDRYADVQLRFKEPGLAEGFIHTVSTPGMRLTEIAVNAGGAFELVDESMEEAAESVFVLNGNFESKFHNIATHLEFGKGHHNFQYNSAFSGQHVFTSPSFHALTITYELSFLKQLTGHDDNKVMNRLAENINDQKIFLATAKAYPWQFRIAEIIHSIRTCAFSGVTRYLFLESKMMELFVLQMEQAQATADERQPGFLSLGDRNKMYALKAFLDTAYLEAFSLKDLTYKFGLNEFKLKKGFKQLFHTTVFGYVHQLRMQTAKALLESKQMNVTETAFHIGYNNVSSFCAEYKKRFGYSPGHKVLQ